MRINPAMDALATDVGRAAPPRDPRSIGDLPARDYDALRYIAAWYQVAQYQLEDAVFAGRSATIASRSVRRLAAAGYVAVERWNRVGVNLLRVTARGRGALIERGGEERAIFVPEKAVALKDLAHHLWIVDTGRALQGLAARLEVAPCWSLRRNLAALKPAAIPDLLALRSGSAGATVAAVAVEVDLGGEGLRNVLVPKLALLRETLGGWAGGQAAAIIVLTVGPRRIAALNAALERLPHRIPIVVLPLPRAVGKPALAGLRASLADVLSS
ncbi:MAG TPA: hypothetical protein VFP80_12955 [Thermoanaerobaculia bacterium]|nr:hypothetical protein [Thermoanaerobaculia bacterium]